ncbi:MAG: 2-amino-4-hydroxy-6-hydroxymethyldihydropteridine diphosphokinase [Roseburia sp.]|nr:2-amino-4-hydroxy-6-hydroxymethyldihydropteridine diphosphokinase [Roseburia sp.]MCM1099015.1 2-amino-4-hydroxy-6-hydroxymethyldihydropteridine diphosphokinase [Ruminococcus flavefaciens]
MYGEEARDEIRIEDLEVYAYHGVYAGERKKGQPFYVNAVLYTDVRRAAAEDELALSADYGAVCALIDRWMGENPCRLLETVAEKLSREILLRFDRIRRIDLEIRKPEAPIPLPFGCVSVKVSRGWHRAWLGLGSNLGDRAEYLDGAVRALREHPLTRAVRESERIVTAPYGGVEQEDFLNSALELETLLSPEELLELLHEIENRAGRERTIHWGPRTLDLDILFYDQLVLESDDLVIPHPDLENREFVLKPLCGLIPNYRHPLLGKTVGCLLEELKSR